MTRVRVGTCSFADEALLKAWYPKGITTGEARLRHYAEHFDTCEIDSTYYRMPDAGLIARWAERVPDGFVFHIKAFAPMTRHPVGLEVLPEELHDVVEADERGRVDRMPGDVRATGPTAYVRYTGGTRRPGTNAGGAPRFGSTTSIPSRSSPSGSNR